MKLRSLLPVLAVAAGVALGGALRAAVSDPNFTQSQFFPAGAGLSQTTGLAWAPDDSGRLFVALKAGQLRIVTAAGVLLAEPFATESVITSSECGLIGFAFDPAFATNGHVYLFVTVSATEQRIVRYTAVGNVGTARTEIVTGLPTRGANHNGGAVGIGPDGKLFWAIGDLGNFTGVNADLASLASKVGRANRDGTVPADNPFVDGPGGNNDFIWARGFRNPFTFTFRPVNGELWINNVGTLYEQIHVTRRGDHAGYNAYENNQPAGFLPPVVKYRTNGTDTRTLAAAPGGLVRTGGTVTGTTTAAHGFRRGELLTIAGTGDTAFHGSFHVTAVPSATTFAYAQAGPDAATGGGTAQTANLGGSVTGGTFLDTSGVPAPYRGDFFFGDFNSGRVVRVTFAPDGGVAAVTSFATGLANAIDLAVGPDGALYGLQFNGRILRWAAVAPPAPALVVTPLHVQTDEGAAAWFTVRLAAPPPGNVTVTTTRWAGPETHAVASGADLVFGPDNWATPQAVRLTTAADRDSLNSASTFEVNAPGFTGATVQLRAIDRDEPTTWAQWREQHFTAAQRADAAISGEFADFDGDGLVTLLEYALGTDALAADAAGRTVEVGLDEGRLTLTHRRRVAATDLAYQVEATSELTAGSTVWSSAGLELIAREAEGAMERVTWRDTAIPAPGQPRIMRLRVVRTP
jgi:glucose/arabinose dehydrogenase